MTDYYLTATGTNPQQLQIRLAWLAREFIRYTSSRAGRPARLDVRSTRAGWMAEALRDAIRAFLDRNGDASQPALVAAIRRAEARWRTVCVELRCEGSDRPNQRPGVAERFSGAMRPRSLPAQRAGAPREHPGGSAARTGRPSAEDGQITRQR